MENRDCASIFIKFELFLFLFLQSMTITNGFNDIIALKLNKVESFLVAGVKVALQKARSVEFCGGQLGSLLGYDARSHRKVTLTLRRCGLNGEKCFQKSVQVRAPCTMRSKTSNSFLKGRAVLVAARIQRRNSHQMNSSAAASL